VTVFSLTYALERLCWRTLAGNVGRKRLLLFSLSLFVAANVLRL